MTSSPKPVQYPIDLEGAMLSNGLSERISYFYEGAYPPLVGDSDVGSYDTHTALYILTPGSRNILLPQEFVKAEIMDRTECGIELRKPHSQS